MQFHDNAPWRDIECRVSQPHRMQGPVGHMLRVTPGVIHGRMRLMSLRIDGLLTAEDAAMRVETQFRTSDGVLWKFCTILGLIDLWFRSGTTLDPVHPEREHNLVLDGVLDTREEYDLLTSDGAQVSGFLKYAATKAYIGIDRHCLTVDLEWLVHDRRKLKPSHTVRYGHRIPHEQILFLPSYRQYTEHSSKSGDDMFVDIVQLDPTGVNLPLSTVLIMHETHLVDKLEHQTDPQ